MNVKMSIEFSWETVRSRAYEMAVEIQDVFLDSSIVRIYPIPRGGVPPALLLFEAFAKMGIELEIVDDPLQADVFIDDVVESGHTRDHYLKIKDIPFFSLFTKHHSCNDWYVFPWEKLTKEDGPQDNIRRIIQYIGEDSSREGLVETPDRVIRSYDTLYAGYSEDPKSVLKTFSDDSCDEMVLLKNVEFYSTCEHHMLPFHGRAHIAYIPDGQVVGISKLARLLEVFSRRLQIQERICQQITSALDTHLEPLGSACILEAQHFCMTSRGVAKQNSEMVTSSLTGDFRDHSVRNELMNLIRS